ncbi:ABC transporter transmembrane region, partial [Cooperia oncophora]
MKAGTYWKNFLFFFLLAMYQLFQTLRSFWLSAWSDENDGHHDQKMPVGWRLAVYGALGSIESVCFLLSLVSLAFAGLAASYNLHAPLLHNLLRSPMSFFDTTPLGRILNRCTKDIDVVDMLLPVNFRYFSTSILQVFFILLVIIISTPIFAVVVVPLMLIYFIILRLYISTARQLKRLESIHRSPVFSNFEETIQGASSVRAFNKVKQFRSTFGATVDAFIKCKHCSVMADRWLAIRLEFIGNLVIFFAALFAVISKEFGWVTSPGIIGVSVSYALNITEMLNFGIRQISESEANIVAVERIDEYTKTPTEAPWEIPENKPDKDWPSHGVVHFDDYSTNSLTGIVRVFDLVLKQFVADIGEGEKIGIVGRTGAGKSSFTLALFRIIEAVSGKIIIDDVDISKIGLHDLRSNITIIPQEPVLFSGTLRFNLDPCGKSTDSQIWEALELAHLKSFFSSLQGGLDYLINEGGENLSVGQRQLVCLARAVLRNTRILVLDEATAAVDVTTDALIQ